MSLKKYNAFVFRVSAAAAACLCIVCCRAPEQRADMSSPYPLDRVRAAVACADRGDDQAVDLLIEMLDDADRGVRMYSILALKRLCSADYGYSYYASDAERAEALERWREARRRGEVHLAPRAAESGRAPTASVRSGETTTTP